MQAKIKKGTCLQSSFPSETLFTINDENLSRKRFCFLLRLKTNSTCQKLKYAAGACEIERKTCF